MPATTSNNTNSTDSTTSTSGTQTGINTSQSYMPFGGGRRTCIGRAFALLEATLVLATIGQDWKFEWKDEDNSMAIEPELTLQTQEGLPMWMKRR